jgi:hypothetical protein
VLFVGLRGLHAYGDPTTWKSSRDVATGIKSFLAVTHDPVSLQFRAMTLCVVRYAAIPHTRASAVGSHFAAERIDRRRNSSGRLLFKEYSVLLMRRANYVHRIEYLEGWSESYCYGDGLASSVSKTYVPGPPIEHARPNSAARMGVLDL